MITTILIIALADITLDIIILYILRHKIRALFYVTTQTVADDVVSKQEQNRNYYEDEFYN